MALPEYLNLIEPEEERNKATMKFIKKEIAYLSKGFNFFKDAVSIRVTECGLEGLLVKEFRNEKHEKVKDEYFFHLNIKGIMENISYACGILKKEEDISNELKNIER